MRDAAISFVQDFRKGVAGVELRRREETEDRGAVGADGCGEGCLPPTAFVPLPMNFFEFCFWK